MGVVVGATTWLNFRRFGIDPNYAARLSKRAEPNLLRTLGKLEAFGLIEMRSEGRRRIPVPIVHKLSVEIDPFSQNDRFELV